MSKSKKTAGAIKIAITATGGQGGGVLAGWIVDLAEAEGWLAQSTSVPGVAQRTGATVYYIEMFPQADADKAGAAPVMALMPAPGDVDVALASEFAEAGRAVMRGFVSPARTTLITSSHRDFAIGEKSAMGDGRSDDEAIFRAARDSAARLIHFDMARLALESGSVISSVLFGALAASKCLPFSRAAFERTIERGGVAVAASLAGFAAAFARVEAGAEGAHLEAAEAPAAGDLPEQSGTTEAKVLLKRIETGAPAEILDTVLLGARRAADYQDLAYAEDYFERVSKMLAADRKAGGAERGFALSGAFAKHLALWMTYEDVIRVADLKTRGTRFERFRREVRAEPDQVVSVSEFMHPRFEEICDTLPRGLGRALLGSELFRALLAPFLKKGRRVHTTRLGGFLALYTLAALRRWRRGTLRYDEEQACIAAWTDDIRTALEADYDLAMEVAACQRLIKGYGDTFARGLGNFGRIMAELPALTTAADGAARLKALREAALADDAGRALDAALAESA